jgi:hypothetical protein
MRNLVPREDPNEYYRQ